MKKLLKFLLFGVACTTLYAGCNNMVNNDITETYPTDVDVSDFNLTETACNWSWQTIKEDTVYVINSTEELYGYISCQNDDVPAIDFEKYSLLLTKGGTTSGVHKIDRKLQQTSINEYKLTVDITLEITTVAQGWNLAALVPKLSSNAIITLNVIKGNTQECEWEIIDPVKINDTFKMSLDSVFSESNELVKGLPDSVVFIINDKESLLKICDNSEVCSQIDFDNQSILWGKLQTSSISDKIVQNRLSVCSDRPLYKLEIVVEKCTECYWAISTLYYWGIYQEKMDEENILLSIN
jgi:hypothetical protein